ncbi:MULTISPECIES: DUF7546 family protein [Haloarcula]|uniref:Uncharacterized protein n=1 Tax=Haloarcula pellucida TaxID=1427151 RepID=A0A830GG41_9EURY|nr:MULTISPECIES: ABC transporter ATP-binding protein [Halomicroarcula]MBX0347075.1 ABC transporter ATP-binding protein [Halomicroarcula pellucida]MDS0277050.1 ABC transporter ATP-binding protein [Halomicroarcula sp. S1AR25-4]GGN86871.1 hypothetical protein GCM10009030_04970 [Halomicroarcula pellucida]
MSTTTATLADGLPDQETLVRWGAVLNTEVLLVLAYVSLADAPTTDPVTLAFPFVWLNAAALVFATVRPPTASARRKGAAFAVAVGYWLVLAYVGGVFGTGGQGTGLRWILAAPPGFSPGLVYSGTTLAAVVLPWKVAGYLSLAYLLYVTVLDASGGLAGGILGLFSCVSCVLPIVASVVGGALGVGGALYQAAMAQSYGTSTLVYLVSVGLLYAAHRFDVTLVGRLRN